MIHQKRVEDLMQPVPHPLHGEMALAEAVDLILQSGLSGLPVVDDEQRVCGFLSEQDCIGYLVSDSYHCDSRIRVKDIMYKEPLCARPGENIIDQVQKMGGDKPKTWPVVDEEGRLLGVVCRRAIMRALNAAVKSCRTRL
ncbi:MAG: CBS domain-containing protein [Pseudomonadota bacterium]|nr:CBS domain-containing protein [Pseudomonadota bacterium]